MITSKNVKPQVFRKRLMYQRSSKHISGREICTREIQKIFLKEAFVPESLEKVLRKLAYVLGNLNKVLWSDCYVSENLNSSFPKI